MTKIDLDTLKKIVDGVPTGTKLAIVVGSSPQACAVLSQAGMKVFCIVPNAELKPFCLACGPMLYSRVFPITGDCRKVPSSFPVKVDMAFIDAPGDFSVRGWMSVVRPGGTLAGSRYQEKMSAARVNRARNMWWKCRPGNEQAKCAWEIMPNGGYNYLQTIATSARISL